MLPTRPFLRAAALAVPRRSVRSFSNARVLFGNNGQKSPVPSLADIEPGSQEQFNSKQKVFREALQAKAARKAQDASASTSSDATAEAADGSPTATVKVLGSLSIAEGSAAEQSDKVPGRKQGTISNLLYGTKEGRELDAQIEASFSQILARGKYMHSILFHEVQPDKVDEYVALVGKWYPRMASMPENNVHLVGSWRTEVGDCDTFVHIWEYKQYEGYHSSINMLHSHPEYPEFERKLSSLIKSKNVSLMQEFSFWPTSPPRQLGGLFELRSYTLHPGNLLEWETHWRRGLKARREVMEGVGAWFVQIGDLNTVHHLWQFANLEERRIRREKCWGIEGWSDTVHKTVPLIQTMRSRILVPMPWSPIA